jgi:hypothetical protein
MATPTLASSSVKSSAKPISEDQLQAELSKSASPTRSEPPPPEQARVTEPPRPEDTTKRIGGTPAPKFMENVDKAILGKKDEAKKEPEAEKKDDGATGKAAATVEKKADAPKKEAVSKDDALPSKLPDEITEEEKGVMPHDSTRVRARIIYLNNEKKRIEAERDAVKKELEEAKKQPATAANTEEVAKLKEEHERLRTEATRLRRLHDISSDTEFNARFDGQVKAAETTISETFKKYGFGEATLKAIEAEGGFAAFSGSTKSFTVQEPDPENEGQMKPVTRTAAELSRSWLNAMNPADSEGIKALLGKQQLLQVEKKQAVQKEMDESKVYFENQTKAQREAQEKAAAETKRLADEYENFVKKTETETDWLKDQPVPEGASPEVAEQIKARNDFYAELRAELRKQPTTAAEYGEIKLRAAMAKHLERSVAEKDAEIERLTAELKKKSAAQKTTGKGGSLLVKDKSKIEDDKPAPGSTDFKSALDRRMAKVISGGED